MAEDFKAYDEKTAKVQVPEDRGPRPLVIDVESETLENQNFRTTRWTGEHLQLTLMAIPAGGDIGLEVHNENDQFLRIESGKGLCKMGPKENELTFEVEVGADMAVFVPAGTWHNIVNTGDEDLKLYTLYGPADHVHGTVHKTQAEAEADPHEH